jgi:Xaa-Pro aminopeptidase
MTRPASLEPFLARRGRVLARMAEGVAIITSAPQRLRARNSYYPYRQDPYLYYLTGFLEPQAVLVLVAGERPRSVFFCPSRDEQHELWEGPRYGPEGAQEVFGFDEAYPVETLAEQLPDLLADQPCLWAGLGLYPEWDSTITSAWSKIREQSRAGVCAPTVLHDVHALLDDMRLVKDAAEIALMQRAAQISAQAHVRALKAAHPGDFEYTLEAELLHEFRRHGCTEPAYPPIVAGGAHACVLHYTANNACLNDGDLVLIDAGAQFEGYAADITRCFPVNGVFSGAQRDVYQCVLAAQQAAIDALMPGVSFHVPHDAAVRVLSQGMLDMGLLQGDLDTVIERADYKRFYMHRTSHWLGLDVHDVGTTRRGDQWRTLEPGMVLTVEPGCYIRTADDIPSAFHDIGVRIEDDVLITTQGAEVLTAQAPKRMEAIEACMASS